MIKYENMNQLSRLADIHIFSDGATFNNGRKKPELPSLGAWGFCVTDGKEVLHTCSGYDSKPEADTTISRMELLGAIEGIRYVIKKYTTRENYEEPLCITVVSDSQYVVQGISQWIRNWIKRGWRNAEGTPTANKDLWEYLAAISGVTENTTVDIHWVKVKGHSDVLYNEVADELAGVALTDLKKRVLSYGNV